MRPAAAILSTGLLREVCLRYCWLVLFGLLIAATPAPGAESYRVERLAEGVYAAIAVAGGGATSNAFFVVGDQYVIAGGAHLSKAGAADLVSAIARVTDRPLRYFILPHHHRGYTAVDFDLPAGCEAVMSVQTWQILSSEVRSIEYPALFFSEGLTLKAGKGKTVILTNLGKGHADGDTLVYLPESKILFPSDLVYVHSVGYIGDGHMTDWVLALEFMSRMEISQVIPGFGPVSKPEVILEFRDYLKSFLSEVLKHLERGDSLEKTEAEFDLPAYRDWTGYQRLTPANVKRAYLDLKATVLN